MKTAKQIIQEAYATSKHNEPGRIADESGELLTLLNARLRRYFAIGGRKNRRFFGKIFDVAFVPGTPLGGWPRPAGLETALKLAAGDTMGNAQIAAGDEVADIPFDQFTAEPGKPAVFNFGQVWYSRAKQPKDPVNGTLRVFGTAAATPCAELDSKIDPLFPDTYTTMLKWDLAAYLALKDGERDNEYKAFIAEQVREEAEFLEYVQYETATEVRSWGHGGEFNSPAIIASK